MKSVQLLREVISLDYTPQMIKESREKNGGRIIVPAVLQKSEVKNQNGRIYPTAVLQREVENYQKAIRENRAVGELDHPESSTVSLKNVSHIIREARWDGNVVKGTLEVLNTPSGKILEGLLESGVTVGISSRGVGSTEKTNEGIDMVQPDFQLICWDCVSEPSTPGAFLFSEGKTVDAPRLLRSDRIFRALNDIVLRK